jgi:hypothetical protein
MVEKPITLEQYLNAGPKIVTAIEILTQRMADAKRRRDEAESALLDAEFSLSVVINPATLPQPYTCGGCGQVLASELEFWSHYEVLDPRTPRLGRCPVKARRSADR